MDDVEVALQSVFDQVYSEGRYADLIDYTQPPPAPALSGEDALWVAEKVERLLVERARERDGP